jgi:hypothetical protein
LSDDVVLSSWRVIVAGMVLVLVLVLMLLAALFALAAAASARAAAVVIHWLGRVVVSGGRSG